MLPKNTLPEMNLRPRRDEWVYFLLLYLMCHKKAHLKFMFIFLETQETGAVPRRQRALGGKVPMTETQIHEPGRPWEGVETVHPALGRRVLNTREDEGDLLRPGGGWSLGGTHLLPPDGQSGLAPPAVRVPNLS